MSFTREQYLEMADVVERDLISIAWAAGGEDRAKVAAAMLRSAADALTPTAGAHIIEGLEKLSATFSEYARNAEPAGSTAWHAAADDLDAFITALKEQQPSGLPVQGHEGK